MKHSICPLRVVLSTAIGAMFVPSMAKAALTLTAAGQAQGLSLTTFASNFPTSGSEGPLGITFPASGGVLVSDQLGNVRLFPSDSDGQNAASAPVGQNYGNGNSEDLARVGSNLYLAEGSSEKIFQINSDGTFNQTIIASGIATPVGMVANPANGHLFVSTRFNDQIEDVDPIAKTVSAFQSIPNPDGLAISPDGKTLYAAATGIDHILGYDIATKALVFDSGVIGGGIDGTAAGAGPFSNFIFVNTNSGTVVEVNLTSLAQTTIASGGSRGDFVTVDPSNNTVLLTQSDQIIRLNGAVFPEPGSIVLVGIAAIGGLGFRRRR